MDIGHFVPQYIKEYYDTSNSDNKDMDTSKDSREPYKAISDKTDSAKGCRREKRMTQQFNFSRNRKLGLYYTRIVQPLQDITKSEINKSKILDSLETNDDILNDKACTMKFDASNKFYLNKFTLASDTNKTSSRSLAKRDRTHQKTFSKNQVLRNPESFDNKQMLNTYDFHGPDRLLDSVESDSKNLSHYQHTDYNYKYKSSLNGARNLNTEFNNT